MRTVESLRSAADSVEKSGIFDAVSDLAANVKLTYRKDLETALKDAGISFIGEWPSYICQDIIGLEIDLQRATSRANGKDLGTMEIKPMIGRLQKLIADLLDRPFDSLSFLHLLAEVCGESSTPVKSVFTAIRGKIGEPNYTQSHFAADLYKLQMSGVTRHDGLSLVLVPTREPSRGLLVGAPGGSGMYVGAIGFRRKEP
jgi:hypothetical protein